MSRRMLIAEANALSPCLNLIVIAYVNNIAVDVPLDRMRKVAMRIVLPYVYFRKHGSASRMESTSEALKVHISETTISTLSSDYSYVERGEISVKGKGIMKTYWLLDCKGRVSCKGDFEIPSMTGPADNKERRGSQLSRTYSPILSQDVRSNAPTPAPGATGQSAQNCKILEQTSTQNCKTLEQTSAQNCKTLEQTSIQNCKTLEQTSTQNCKTLELTSTQNCKTLEQTSTSITSTKSQHQQTQQHAQKTNGAEYGPRARAKTFSNAGYISHPLPQDSSPRASLTPANPTPQVSQDNKNESSPQAMKPSPAQPPPHSILPKRENTPIAQVPPSSLQPSEPTRPLQTIPSLQSQSQYQQVPQQTLPSMANAHYAFPSQNLLASAPQQPPPQYNIPPHFMYGTSNHNHISPSVMYPHEMMLHKPPASLLESMAEKLVFVDGRSPPPTGRGGGSHLSQEYSCPQGLALAPSKNITSDPQCSDSSPKKTSDPQKLTLASPRKHSGKQKPNLAPSTNANSTRLTPD
ncbi:Soluble guanylate cyclase 88E [Armadillidium nasatum]|uniref:Soluble guanylate cyclase 88E n=1 Tax=Armadillidium nasatum TaxID=96803 RepID=A0A5N5TMA3_9CRUS|nr:Soluble guanylate cyclase 88E [Armadillidium nasatum]